MNTDEMIGMSMMEKLTGVSQHTLRAWEKRYAAIEPVRVDSGRRAYSMKDVKRIRHLAHAVANGHSIGLIAHLTDEQLKSLHSTPGALATRNGEEPEEAHRIVRSILKSVASYEPGAVDLALTRACALFTAPDFILQIVAPLLSQVGQEVERRRLNVAQEHLLSSILRTHLGRLYQSFLALPASGPIVLFATPEGNLHEFGILLAAILAALQGLRTHFLGANLPAQDLLKAAHDTGAAILVIGATAIPPEIQVRPLTSYFSEIDKKLPKSIEVWLGGDSALSSSTGFRRHKPRLIASLEQFAQEVGK